MASVFPGAIDSFTDPLSGSALNSPSHSAQHADLNDAAEKIEAFMGLVKVTSGALSSTATNFVGCFTSLYENYRIVLSKVNVGAGFMQFQMLNSSTAFTSALYHTVLFGTNSSAGAVAVDRVASGSSGYFTYNFQNTTDGSLSCSYDFMNPFGTGRTFYNGNASSFYDVTPFFQVSSGGGGVNSTNSFDGIRISSAGGGTLIGNVAIYGYRN